MRKFNKKTYQEFKKDLKEFKSDKFVVNVDEFYGKYESRLTFLGVAGVEDTLR